MNYTVYDKETGLIEWSGECAESDFEYLYIPEDCAVLAKKASAVSQYVDLVGLDVLDKSDYTLETLPIPCVATIDGVEYEVTAQPEFSFPVPGIYFVSIDAGAAFYRKDFDYDAN